MTDEKALMTLKEVSEYLGIGITKTRELMAKQRNPFTLRIGNRIYANKKLLDKWLDDKSGNLSSRKY